MKLKTCILTFALVLFCVEAAHADAAHAEAVDILGSTPESVYGSKGKKNTGGTGSGLMSGFGTIVHQTIKKNWRCPLLDFNKALAAVLEVKIDPQGKILSSRVVTPSGDPVFDHSAMRAVAETKTLPAPPKGLDTLRITFNMQDLRK